MKKLVLFAGALLLSAFSLVAESAKTLPSVASSMALKAHAKTNALGYTIRENSDHHRVWNKAVNSTNKLGKVSVVTNSFVELGAGMYHQDKGAWVESDPIIAIQPNGSAAALKTGHKVNFAANINTHAPIQLTTVDNKQIKMRVLGIAYYDFKKQKSALIAELKDSTGVLIGKDQVLYPDAFTDIKADLRYTNRKGGFEQDVILRERPPLPEAFGFDPRTTWLEVWTEFINPPEPQRKQAVRKGWKKSLVDRYISFGKMQIVEGTAYGLVGENNVKNGLIVKKHWEKSKGRTFLIEEVAFRELAPRLRSLPEKNATAKKSSRVASRVSPNRVLPKVIASTEGLKTDKFKIMEVAGLDTKSDGFVVDAEFQTIEGDVTLQGDTTYLISSPLGIDGTLTIEGGTVVKYAPGGALYALRDIRCLTDSYRPAIFTAIDDNTCGEVLSTNTISGGAYYADVALGLSEYGGELHNLHMRYANIGIRAVGLTNGAYTVSHSQFIHSGTALQSEWCTFAAKNVLFYDVTNAFGGYFFNGTAEHVTVDHAQVFSSWDVERTGCPPSEPGIVLVNSLITDVEDLGNQVLHTNHTEILSSSEGVYQTVGAASHYLVSASEFRDAGTIFISPDLAFALRKKTTFAPLLFNATNFPNGSYFPQAGRDTNVLDLGYHYDPLDYVIDELAYTNTLAVSVLLTNNVALGFSHNTAEGMLLLGGYGFCNVVSLGLPGNPNHFVWYNTVQEQATTNWNAPGGRFMMADGGMPFFEASFKNTYFSQLGSHSSNFFFGADLTSGYGGPIASTRFSDCQFFNGSLEFAGAGGCGGAPAYYFLTNNLFHRTAITFLPRNGDLLNVVAYNNLFWNNPITFQTNSLLYSYSFFDNLFDKTTINQNGAIIPHQQRDFNAYVYPCNVLTPEEDEMWTLGDRMLSESPAYQTGPLGAFYYPSNSVLIDTGSRSASLAGLTNYTTLTNQTTEGTSTVDIGFHYPAVNLDDYIIRAPEFNHAPSFSLIASSVFATNYSGSNVFTDFAIDITSGPEGEESQAVTFVLTTTDTNFFSVQPAIASNGTLSFELSSGANGTNTVTVVLTDDGGTANEGADTSEPQIFDIIVTNPPPVGFADSFETLEDTLLSVSVPGVLANDTNREGITISAVLIEGALHGTVNLQSDGSFTYMPESNYYGSDSFKYAVSDGIRLSDPFEVILTILSVNDRPVFILATNLVGVQNTAGLTTISNFVSSFNPGPSNESSQTVTFVVTAADTNRFSIQPAITSNGSLSFAPTSTTGTNTVTVFLTDNGGTANGGTNVSWPQTFEVLVLLDHPPVSTNDTYSLTEDSILSVGAPGLLANDRDLETTNLSVRLVTNAVYGAVQLNANGSFTYTPVTNFNGNDSFSYVANDGYLDGNVATVTISVSAVNDAPAFSLATNALVLVKNTPFQVISNFVLSIFPGASNELSQTVTFSLSVTNSSFFSIQPTVDVAGTLTFKLATNILGTNFITIQATDDGGTSGGGINTSSNKTFALISKSTNTLSGLISCWPADGTAIDIVGGNHGSVTNGVTYVSGMSGQAFKFDGTNSAVLFGATAGNFGANDFTIEYWMKNSSTRAEGIFEKRPACNMDIGPGWWDIRSSGPIGMAIAGTNLQYYADLASSGNVSDGTWHHLAWVRQAKVLRCYVDGALAGSKTASGIGLVSNSAILRLGNSSCNPIDGTAAYSGAIDELEIFNRALTLTEIQSLYSQGQISKVPPPNTAPSFALSITNVIAPATGGLLTFPNFATNILAGAPTELWQQLTFVVTTTNPALFEVAPALSSDGTLTFKPVGQLATNFFSVCLRDSGGKLFGGVDVSDSQGFSIMLRSWIPAPDVSPTGGTYTNLVSVTISNSLAGATNLYAVNGTNWVTFTNAFSLLRDSTVIAQTVKNEYYPSPIVTNVYVFSDSDGDGLTDAEENYSGSSWSDYYNGAVPQLTIISGNNQLAVCDSFVAQPLVVKVTDTNGTPLANAPLTFSLSEGNGLLTTATNVSPVASLSLRSAADGKVSAFLYLPKNTSATNKVAVSAQSGSNINQVVFTTDEKLRTPVIYPPGGSYAVVQAVRCAAAGANVTVHYTTNGEEPTEADPVFPLGGTVTVDSSFVKVKAWKAGAVTSETKAATYVRAGQIAAGDNHTLVLRVDGTVYAAGYNAFGQLGDGTQVNHAEFAPVVSSTGETLSNITAIAAGGSFSLAISNGYVYSWGGQFNGELGNNTGGSAAQKYPVKVFNISNIVAVSASWAHALALESNGTVWAWGQNSHGQLGDNSLTDRSIPVKVLDAVNHQPLTNTWSQILAVSAGQDHCVALANSTVLTWGQSVGNAWNDAFSMTAVGSHYVTGAWNLGATNVLGIPEFIAGGANYSLYGRDGGSLWGWGINSYGQLGNRTNRQATIIGVSAPTELVGPTPVYSSNSFVQVACSDFFAVALNKSGTISTWGRNDWGQLGDGTVRLTNGPVQVLGVTNAVAIAVGIDHVVALTADGNILGWGRHEYGQTGTGEYDFRSSPGIVPGLSNITAIAAGYAHNLAISGDGHIYSWGDNNAGKLGDGTTTIRSTPVVVSSLTNVSALSAGDDFSMAISNGVVWSWGRSYEGQLGDGRAAGSNGSTAPVKTLNPKNTLAIASGASFGLALSNGIVWSWGYNAQGQLGRASATTGTPGIITNLSGVSAIGAGHNHALAVSNGCVWTWGYNIYGQLGNGNSINATLPVLLPNLTNITAVSGGANHSLALSNGYVLSWGLNTSSQLGNNTTTTTNRPVLVSNLSSVTAISAGFNHSLALASDGTVWAWGANSRGQLGNGTNVNSKVPIQVPDLTDIVAVSAGDNHSLALGNDGTVYAWGDALNYGQLGDGNVGYNSQPASIQPEKAGFNAAPQIFAPTNVSSPEDMVYSFTNLHVQDVDSFGGQLEMYIAVTNGVLNFVSSDGTPLFDEDYLLGDLWMSGTVEELNEILASLQYVPRQDFHGLDALTIVVSDLGNSGIGGEKTNSFEIVVNVLNVNDRPSFLPGYDQIASDSGDRQVIPQWASEISAGPVDESGQQLLFSVTNDNPSLFLEYPSISIDGTLTFTPMTNAEGIALVTVFLSDDGGSANGGVDVSEPYVFPISVGKTALAHWDFNDTNWFGDAGQVPIIASNLVLRPSWSAAGVYLNETSGPSRLEYAGAESDGWPNVSFQNGSIRVWINPQWSSADTNSGTGPLTNSSLIEISGISETNDSRALKVSADGTSLYLCTQTNTVIFTNLVAGISILSNQWHQLALTYSITNTSLYLDGIPLASGPGAAMLSYPGDFGRLRLGGSPIGTNGSRCFFDEMETFNYVLTQEEIAVGYTNALALDSDADGLSDMQEFFLGTDPFDYDTDGDDLVDGFESQTGTDPLTWNDANYDGDYDGRTALQEQEDGTDPNDSSSVEPVLLASWRFDNDQWIGDQEQRPIAFTNIINVSTVQSNGLMISTNVAAFLKYKESETNGTQNINLRNGSIHVSVRPEWQSTHVNGTNDGVNFGPGAKCTLFEVGSSTNSDWWTLEVDPDGDHVNLFTQSNGVLVTNFSATIGWVSNEWYHLVITYCLTNSSLYVNGHPKETNGLGVTLYPRSEIRASGFSVGSSQDGSNQIKGILDDLECYNFVLSKDFIDVNTYTPVPDPVKVIATAPYCSETGGYGEFTVTRDDTAENELKVYFTVTDLAGKVNFSKNYALYYNGKKVAAPARGVWTPLRIDVGKFSATINVIPLPHTGHIDPQYVMLTLKTAEQMGTSQHYDIDPSYPSAVVKILDDSLPSTVNPAYTKPSVSIKAHATLGAVSEGSMARFTLTRSGPVIADLIVKYRIAGTAKAGDDYTPLAGSVLIPSGSKTAAVDVYTLTDDEYEFDESVTVYLEGDATYNIASPIGAFITIRDSNPEAFEIVGPRFIPNSKNFFSETIYRKGVNSQKRTFGFGVSYNQTGGSGVTFVPGSVTFNPSVGSATVNISKSPQFLVDYLQIDLKDANNGVWASYVHTVYEASSQKAASIAFPGGIEAIRPNGSTGGRPITATLTRPIPAYSTDVGLTAYFTIKGLARNGVDFQVSGAGVTELTDSRDPAGAYTGSVVFGVGETIKTVTIVPLSLDEYPKQVKSMVFRLYNAGTSPDQAYKDTRLEIRDNGFTVPTGYRTFDSDGDGVADWDELNGVLGYYTDPNLADTDGDGINDGDEIRNKTNPLVANIQGDKDSDLDGVSDRDELLLGTSSSLKDSDGDGVSDFWDSKALKTHCDTDGVNDFIDAFPTDASHDGKGVGPAIKVTSSAIQNN